ncbi:MAG: acyl-CoA dehydrogenase family protein [Dehalococcoidia bacterium]|nr:acyl-CoA dehydrogenase family protein [Dehalococcoidia bacterium]
MAFDIPEEERMIVDGLRRFNDQVSIPLEKENHQLFSNGRYMYDEDGREVPKVRDLFRQVRMASSKAGFFTITLPKELGGGGRGALTTFNVWELLNSAYGPEYELPHVSISHWATGPGPLLLGLPDPCRSQVLPSLSSGEKAVAFAMSEPDAGSDAWNMKTRAVRDGDDWIINGTKQWISGGPYADFVLVFAITDPVLAAARRGGISCFFVDAKSPGYSTAVIRIWGEVGGNKGILSFSDVRVPNSQLVGELGQGFRLAMAGVANGRLFNTGRAVGMSQWALRKATKYSQERIAFNGPIAMNQGVSFQLAECAIELHAAKCMGLALANMIDRGERVVKEMNMTKAFATEMCFRVYDRCIQVFGGMGVTNETALYRGFQHARTVRIADGTSEILRRNIAQELFRGNLD